jgi:preprotein translocase subunit SecD
MFVVAGGGLAACIATSTSPVLGLDLQGGLSVVLQPTGPAASSQLNEAVTIIDRRVNGLGVANSEVSVQGNDVVINLPGIQNRTQALKELETTAQLFFRPVICQIADYAAPSAATTTTTLPKGTATTTVPPKASPASTPSTAPSTAKAAGRPNADLTSLVRSMSATAGSTTTATTVPAGTTTTTVPAGTTTTTVPAGTTTTPTTLSSSQAQAEEQAWCSDASSASLPSTSPADDVAGNPVILPADPQAMSASARFVLGPADMSGTAVSDAAAEINSQTGQYTVNLTLTSSGAAEFDKLATSRYACNQQDPSNPPPCSLEAFELDAVVESAPTFTSGSFNGQVQISGTFSSDQATALANELKYGSLPVPFKAQSVDAISATIGKDSLHAGLLAGIGGILVVMIYMIVYYRALGLVVLVGLAVGGSILYSLICLLGQTQNFTLTLAGVTGIIVSIGITVDSYVVYFERLKDEVRAGRSVRQSVERSFARAFRTVLTADLVSFLAALVLYIFTIGDVRGFAYTLGMSTLLDVATAYLFIRPAVIFVGRRRTFTENRFLGITRGLGSRTETREA